MTTAMFSVFSFSFVKLELSRLFENCFETLLALLCSLNVLELLPLFFKIHSSTLFSSSFTSCHLSSFQPLIESLLLTNVDVVFVFIETLLVLSSSCGSFSPSTRAFSSSKFSINSSSTLSLIFVHEEEISFVVSIVSRVENSV